MKVAFLSPLVLEKLAGACWRVREPFTIGFDCNGILVALNGAMLGYVISIERRIARLETLVIR